MYFIYFIFLLFISNDDNNFDNNLYDENMIMCLNYRNFY